MKPSAADLQWIQAGIARHPVAVLVPLFLSWSLAWIAVWIGTVFLVLGVTFAAIEGITGHPLGAAGGFIGGAGLAITAIVAFYGALFVAAPLNGSMNIIIGLIFGGILGFAVTVGVMYAEPWVLQLRGYRRLSRRESAAVDPLLDELADRMGLTHLPHLMMADDSRPAAWTHCRHIVLTTGMLSVATPDPSGLTRQRLTAVLAHELAHWKEGDGIGATAVWAAALPLMLAYSVAAWLTRGAGRPTVVTLVCYIVLWPAFFLMRLMIAPIYAWEGRNNEYAADAAVVRLGLGPALAEALGYHSMFEPARSGWSEVLTAEHPPTELRLEAIEAKPPPTPRQKESFVPRAEPRPEPRVEQPRPQPQSQPTPQPRPEIRPQPPAPQPRVPEPRPAAPPRVRKDVPPSRGPDLWVPPSHYGPGRPPPSDGDDDASI